MADGLFTVSGLPGGGGGGERGKGAWLRGWVWAWRVKAKAGATSPESLELAAREAWPSLVGFG